jgi:hypothetical protein
MASKSKRAQMAPKRNYSKIFLFWAVAVLIIKLGIIFRIQGFNINIGGGVYLVDGAWLGADGENYLNGYLAMVKDGVFSQEGILNYWPAGYPLLILSLSFFGQSWVLTTISIVQSLFFSFAAYFFASELSKTRLNKFSYFSFVLILLNPTLSLSSMAIGYESITASGLLVCMALIIRSFLVKEYHKYIKYLIITSFIFSLLTFVQPRLILTGFLINFIWILARSGQKSILLILGLSVVVIMSLPSTLIYRNNQAIGLNSISTNLGNTMNIGAGDKATGGYMKEGFGVPCKLSGTSVEQDNQRVKCVANWYLSNPQKAIKLFYNKSINFWSPWYGPIADGTMARNPWLTLSPLSSWATTPEGFHLIYGDIGILVSWLWLLGGLATLVYGFLVLRRLGPLERFIGNIAVVAILTNWLITLISIGDHRFRMPIMGLSLFLQAVGIKALFQGDKPSVTDAEISLIPFGKREDNSKPT